ncbi:MAG: hypothetical protein NXI08_11060 [bacterium]|nr:hypothetical protein [bacterium]
MRKKAWLQIAAMGCFIIAITHVGIAIVGGDWYVFFGAGQEMADMDASGSWYPFTLTMIIALVFSIWGCYALSAIGEIRRLPLQKTALRIISAVLLLRGLSGFILPFVSNHPFILQNSNSFWMITSAISSALGVFFLMGLIGMKK